MAPGYEGPQEVTGHQLELEVLRYFMLTLGVHEWKMAPYGFYHFFGSKFEGVEESRTSEGLKADGVSTGGALRLGNMFNGQELVASQVGRKEYFFLMEWGF
ncbi:hypothetical protein GOP47_0008754 [Adiantum capillus-veneris]|uniref:Uncharacterized protein n=1 Tax=Adiantum capillus-veneris TaxID=13818 RepID=A0A9D4ZIG7_ADICA|nr:hypothetical protein GOP47_0008754 [Adiantum capillus-veneris]